MSEDVLRQRRDLYAVALGLILFQLAHGTIEASGSFGSPYPYAMKFANPCWFLWAAWIGFGYFLLRFRMLAPDKVLSMWWEEILLQAGASRVVRSVAAEHSKGYLDQPDEAIKQAVLDPTGPVPVIEFHHKHPMIVYPFSLTKNRYGTGKDNQPEFGAHIAGNSEGLTASARRKILFSVYIAVFTSIARERTFTDYVLPYAVATATVGIAVLYYAFGRTELCCVTFS